MWETDWQSAPSSAVEVWGQRHASGAQGYCGHRIFCAYHSRLASAQPLTHTHLQNQFWEMKCSNTRYISAWRVEGTDTLSQSNH